MNVYDYFHTSLGKHPKEKSLRHLPIDSNCGDDCKVTIDAAKKFLELVATAVGIDSRECKRVIELTEKTINVFWLG